MYGQVVMLVITLNGQLILRPCVSRSGVTMHFV
jgi:hypothetical protein